ncbi:MAG: 5-bromo-4-chloroindolyl phosphate hydrolysis family protein [Faecalibacterium sp.]|jgi:hypothetical protein|nr:5-bromo-4-chloroindolyl phosphate hydrolysis family protein [Faecalibacterium sp.]
MDENQQKAQAASNMPGAPGQQAAYPAQTATQGAQNPQPVQGTQPAQNVQPPQPVQAAQGQPFRAPETNVWANQYRQPAAPAQGQPAQPGTLPNERELQDELEDQIRAFGESLTNGFRYGFDGRGGELGSRARGMGTAFMDVVNYGLAQGQQAIEQNRARQAAGTNMQYGNYAYSYNARNRNRYRNRGHYDRWNAQAPKSPLRKSANNRFGIGLAQTITGGVMLFCFGLGGLICAGLGLGLIEGVLLIVGGSLLAACLPFLWLTIRGAQNLKASGKLRAYASIAGVQQAVSLASLAQASQRSIADTKKDIRKMLRRGWLTAWMDEDTNMLYFSEQAYYATLEKQQKAEQEAAATAEQQQKAERETKDNATLSSMKNFIDVLEKEKAVMANDPQAVAELSQMQKTSGAIFDWVKDHPDSMPKAQRLANYYIPTTLKLLRTYNEVGTTGGDNAESIRRDVAGMLHTLNTAFSNLHDNLLSDVALDVSSEIAAMQGMLARDGLSENDLLKPQE